MPDDDITGLSTHGIPIRPTAARTSSWESANAYGEVGRPSSSAASRRMPSRSMVSRVARAVGTTVVPPASTSASAPVAIASISGITRSGASCSISVDSETGSVMSIACQRWATWCAGAPG